MDKHAIAIIPARGGSKRIPGKNKRDFLGKPIICYSIEAALKCGRFDEVMVSTDDEEIAEIAKKAGAKVPFMRSRETSGDYATTEDVLLEVLDCYKERGQVFDFVACIYATAPFVTEEILTYAMEQMSLKRPIQIVPVVEFSYPPQRCFVKAPDGYVKYKYPEYATARSQDLEKQYHDVGQFYVYDVNKLYETKGIMLEGFLPIVLSDLQVQDIDNETDWKLAEIKYKLMRQSYEEGNKHSKSCYF